MPWRITYWRGTTRLREMIKEGSKSQNAAMLEKLIIQQPDFDIGNTGAVKINQFTAFVRVNHTGSMLWTTGKDYHYVAERFPRADAIPNQSHQSNCGVSDLAGSAVQMRLFSARRAITGGTTKMTNYHCHFLEDGRRRSASIIEVPDGAAALWKAEELLRGEPLYRDGDI